MDKTLWLTFLGHPVHHFDKMTIEGKSSYIAVLCNSRITAEPLYQTLLFIAPYAAANNTALLA